MVSRGIGAPVPRVEDRRLVTGHGLYVDDRVVAGVTHAAVVRSPHAHATIRAIRTEAALAIPGVLAVLTGDDYARDGLGGIPCTSVPAGLAAYRPPFPALAHGRVRCVGDAVALVVAEGAATARDAAARVEVEYEPHPAAASIEAALAPGAPMVWDGAPDNVAFVKDYGDAAATNAALARAAHVTELVLEQNRVTGVPMEPRSYVGAYDAIGDRYTLFTTTQQPHRIKRLLATDVLRVPGHRVHVVAGDVGGGFGTKGGLYPEEILVVWAARRIGRPVKWVSDRAEAFLADFQGRDHRVRARLGLDRDGRIVGLEAAVDCNVGCQLSPSGAVVPLLVGRMMSGPYAIAAIAARIRAVLTHTRTVTPYRGSGRPEATYLLERLLDRAAVETGIDAIDLRRRNLITKAAMPYRTAVGETYDCGDFPAVLTRGLDAAEWASFDMRRDASRRCGRLRGRGVAMYVEVCGIANERMEIRFDPTGCATVVAGTFSAGQGHATVYAQMVSQWLGVPFETVHVVQGDTDQVSHGGGSYGSRSMCVGGAALRHAADQVVERGRRVAAFLMEAAVADVEFARGRYAVRGTDRSVGITDVARAVYAPGGFPIELGVGLEAVGYFAAAPFNYPNGCHVAEVEIDPETGAVSLVAYSALDDVGVIVNPLLLDGQLHGGIAQGAGQALTEVIVLDAAGQLVTGSFMDYAIPRADELPAFVLGTENLPTSGNPLGVKGGGELGTVGACAAVTSAVLDALRPLGVEHIDMPATPSRVWETMARARTARKEAR